MLNKGDAVIKLSGYRQSETNSTVTDGIKCWNYNKINSVLE